MADRKSTITLALNDLISGNTTRIKSALDDTARASENLGGRQTSLHQILGTSRRETILFEQSLLQLTGTSGFAAQAVSALATGIGPVGLAIVGISAGVAFLGSSFMSASPQIEAVTKSLDSLAKKDDVAATLTSISGASLTTTEEALKYAQSNADAAASLKELVERGKPAIPFFDELGTRISGAKDQLINTIKATPSFYSALLQGKSLTEAITITEQNYQDVIRGTTNAQADAIRATLERMAAEQSLANVLNEQASLYTRHFNAQIALKNALLDTGKAGADAARQIKQAYEDAEKAASRALDSLIDKANKPTTVTAEDQLLTSLGLYVDKFDEARRRLDTIKQAGRITGTDDIPRMFGLLPLDIQKELQGAVGRVPPFSPQAFAGLPKNLQDAVRASFDTMPPLNPDTFKKLSPELQKAINADLSSKAIKVEAIRIEQEEGGKLIDPNKLADQVQKDLQAAKDKIALQTKVKGILKTRGVDTSDPEVQKSLGIETGAERAAKINAQLDFSQGQIREALEKALTQTNEMVSGFKISPALGAAAGLDQPGLVSVGKQVAVHVGTGVGEKLAQEGVSYAKALDGAVGAGKDAFEKVGDNIGDILVKRIARTLSDAGDDMGSAIVRAFKAFGDGRYMQIKNPGTTAP